MSKKKKKDKRDNPTIERPTPPPPPTPPSPSSTTTPETLKSWRFWIPIGVALILGVLNFTYTRSVNENQNARLFELNRPRFAFVETSMIAWEELDKETAKMTNWGYPALIFTFGENHLASNKLRRYSALVLWDVKKNLQLIGYNEPKTMEEAHKTINNLPYEVPYVAIKQLFEFTVKYRNAGTLPAKNVRINVFVKYDQGKESLVPGDYGPLNQIPGGSIHPISPVLYLSTDKPFPAEITVRIEFRFESDLGEETNEIVLRYYSRDNSWKWIE